jgi:acyl carrier protein
VAVDVTSTLWICDVNGVLVDTSAIVRDAFAARRGSCAVDRSPAALRGARRDRDRRGLAAAAERESRSARAARSVHVIVMEGGHMEDSARDGAAAGASGAARTETEKLLVQIWSEVLEVEQVGIHDDFIGMGGDSLAAMRCINRVRTALGIELPLDLFLLESSCIAEAAAELDRLRHGVAEVG